MTGRLGTTRGRASSMGPYEGSKILFRLTSERTRRVGQTAYEACQRMLA
jgi:hypothetical protein